VANVLVHLVTGPENATRAALALLVARTAAEEGHEVRVFLAGDGVQLARHVTREAVSGAGTGNAAEHWTALEAAGVPIFLSRLSSKARGIDEGGELSPPARLVELSVWADTVLTY
jgi:predicted peroxiredoxin